MELLDLPNEVLAIILSNLSLKEILIAAKVCWKFNDVSMAPSAWKIIKVKIGSKEELQSFCEYFEKRPFIKEFFLEPRAVANTISSPRNELYQINPLFGRSLLMRSLYIRNSKVSSISFPPYLNRLYIFGITNYQSTRSAFSDTKFPTVLKDLSIQGKFDKSQIQMNRITNEEIKHALKQNEFSLTTLSLDIREFDSRTIRTNIVMELPSWLPQVLNCLNLKRLKLNVRVTCNEFTKLFIGISKLPSLEVLHFKYTIPEYGPLETGPGSHTSKDVVFPKLKEFFVNGNWFALDEYAKKNSFPKLETFSLEEINHTTFETLFSFIKCCISLKNIRLSSTNLYSATANFLLIEMTLLMNLKKYQSICLCALQYHKSSCSDKTRIKNIKEKLSFFNCSKKIFGRHCSQNSGERDFYFGSPFQENIHYFKNHFYVLPKVLPYAWF